MNVKVGGIWKPVKKPSVKVAGVWEPVKKVFTKVSGVWEEVYYKWEFTAPVSRLSPTAYVAQITQDVPYQGSLFNSVTVDSSAYGSRTRVAFLISPKPTFSTLKLQFGDLSTVHTFSNTSGAPSVFFNTASTSSEQAALVSYIQNTNPIVFRVVE